LIFAFRATIRYSQQFPVFFDYPAIILLLSTSDPETPRPGSPENASARGGGETPHTGIPHHPVTPHIVFFSRSVTRHAGGEKAALLISWPCYTSGKSHIAEKSDQAGAAIR